MSHEGYSEFLKNKIRMASLNGLPCEAGDVSPTLKPHQRDIVQWAVRGGQRAIFAQFGLGKCHGAGTRILMADCSIKNVEDIEIGDQLMGDDGTPRNVLSLARGQEELYRVTLKNKDSYTCNKSHIFSLKVSDKFQGNGYGEIVDMELTQYMSVPYFRRKNCLKHYKVPLEFPKQDIPFDPYLYGAWLGDGHQKMLAWTINSRDTEIVERITAFAASQNLTVRETKGYGCSSYFLVRNQDKRGRAPQCDEFYFVQGSVVNGEKRIDWRYLKNSRETRLQLLAGIIDTDGHNIDKCLEVSTKWAGLKDDILFLARSLGFSVTHTPKIVNGATYWRIWISGGTHLIPCVTRKKPETRRQIKNPLAYGFDVDPIGVGDYYGFVIDGNHRYLLADFTVTHNTLMQLEICRILHERTGARSLIVCPLGVRQEFFRDAGMLGITLQFVRRAGEMNKSGAHFITNYESIRDGRLDPSLFDIVSLDEASVLRSYGSRTYQEFLPLFTGARFKFVATATPSPNRYKELIHYAGFLGVMDTGHALDRFFKRDSEKAGNLTLLPHKAHEFWLWMHSWAIFLQKPSELGYSDEGYDMPPLEVIYHEIPSPNVMHKEKDGQGLLFVDSSVSLTDAAREKRDSVSARVAEAARIVSGDPESHYILWHTLERERRAIEKAVPEAASVHGTMDLDAREQRIIDFSEGRIKYLATKPSISGSGCNFQRFCHKAVFVGIDFRFNDFIQSVHRIHRFLQDKPCEIHVIYTEAEREILQVLKRKWQEHKSLLEKMSGIVAEHGLDKLSTAPLERTLGLRRQAAAGRRWEAVNNDCVDETAQMPDNSVDLTVTSIPFSNHYEYTPSYNDFGHTENNGHFWEQMDFLTPELLRVTKPGRIACIHVKDRVLFANVTGAGAPTISPFHAEAIFHYIRHGWNYMGMITVVTDVVRENNQTYRLGWTEQCRDGSKMGVGSPEYVLLFRKPQSDRTRGFADARVVKDKSEYTRSRWQIDAHAFWRSDGKRLISAEDIAAAGQESAMKLYARYNMEYVYDYEEHVRIGEALDGRRQLSSTFMTLAPLSDDPFVWTDVARMRTLNGEQNRRGLALHICPLQFDIVDRLIRRYSNPDDIVFDPFGGLMTVPYRALLLGRRGLGIELSEASWRDGVRYLEQAEGAKSSRTLFDEDDGSARIARDAPAEKAS